MASTPADTEEAPEMNMPVELLALLTGNADEPPYGTPAVTLVLTTTGADTTAPVATGLVERVLTVVHVPQTVEVTVCVERIVDNPVGTDELVAGGSMAFVGSVMVVNGESSDED